MEQAKKIKKIVVVGIVIAGFIAGIFLGYFLRFANIGSAALSPEECYQAAVEDAVEAEPNEILPLIEIAPGSDMATWNAAGDKVLLLTWNKHPESYVAGEQATLKWGEVWTFTDKEIAAWYDKNAKGVTDWNLRLEQLIGLPPDCGYTHISALWVSPEDVVRPAYVTDITTDKMQTTFSESADEDYVAWFDNNIIGSYFDGAYPWTRLGYTYDWKPDENEYGLSEFIIAKDSTVDVEFTLTTEEFVEWMNAN